MTRSLSMWRCFIGILIPWCLLASCGLEKKMGKSARGVLDADVIRTAHIGISIYEPATGKYWYDYQGDRYFVPASNTKIPTCYAAMKHLGDSLVSFSYDEYPGRIVIFPSGDPSFLNPEFIIQPGVDFLKAVGKPIELNRSAWKESPLGPGWSWGDYEEPYAAERSIMPLYGNLMTISGSLRALQVEPRAAIRTLTVTGSIDNSFVSSIHRTRTGNHITIAGGANTPATRRVTLDTEDGEIIAPLLKDTLHLAVEDGITRKAVRMPPALNSGEIFSQATDSLLRPMMHRSDNFYAEQSLLMVSNRLLGVMNDRMVIDTLLKNDFNDLPQKPRWVDGSGLSRYNLFTPQDFVAILNKMRREFGMDRLRTILPTGGEGTISSYYKADSGYIYGKTGTLSGVVAFSGFLTTRKNKQLIFSILVNNHTGSAADVRRAVEKFLLSVRNQY